MSQSRRHRSRHHEQPGRVHGGRRAGRDPRQEWRRAWCRRSSRFAERDQCCRPQSRAGCLTNARAHCLLGEAADGPRASTMCSDEAEAVSLSPRRGRSESVSFASDWRSRVHSAGDLGVHPSASSSGTPKSSSPSRRVDPKSNAPSSPCRRTSTTRSAGHQGRRAHRRARGAAPGERADRGGAGLRARQAQQGVVAVYDFGGGTFDISILAVKTASSRCSPPTATRISAATTSIC